MLKLIISESCRKGTRENQTKVCEAVKKAFKIHINPKGERKRFSLADPIWLGIFSGTPKKLDHTPERLLTRGWRSNVSNETKADNFLRPDDKALSRPNSISEETRLVFYKRCGGALVPLNSSLSSGKRISRLTVVSWYICSDRCWNGRQHPKLRALSTSLAWTGCRRGYLNKSRLGILQWFALLSHQGVSLLSPHRQYSITFPGWRFFTVMGPY